MIKGEFYSASRKRSSASSSKATQNSEREGNVDVPKKKVFWGTHADESHDCSESKDPLISQSNLKLLSNIKDVCNGQDKIDELGKYFSIKVTLTKMRTKPTNILVTLQHDIKKNFGVKFWLLISDKNRSIRSSKLKKRNKPKTKKVFPDSCPENSDTTLAEKCDPIDKHCLKYNVINAKIVVDSPSTIDSSYNR